jgi:hypothetical protein
MLRKLTRDETKPSAAPHPFKVHNCKHHYQIGNLDFPQDRQQSTAKYFHDKKNRISNYLDHKDRTASQLSISHSHGGNKTGLSMSKNDYAPFTFNKVDRPVETLELPHSALKKREDFGYSEPTKISSSLVERNLSEVRTAIKTLPTTSKVNLLKSKFQFSNDQTFQTKSNYGVTFTDPSAALLGLPNIRFKQTTRKFDIINGSNKHPRDPNHCKYEFYDPVVQQHRSSFNRMNVHGVVSRVDPITGRSIQR